MKLSILQKMIFFILLIAIPSLSTAQRKIDNRDIWTSIDEKEIPVVGQRLITPIDYKTYKLSLSEVQRILNMAPMEFTPVAKFSNTYLPLPMPDGSIELFDIVESPIMEPGLSEIFPEINTYAGNGVNNPDYYVRLDLTPQGFHAMIMIPGESTVYIDPYTHGGGDIQHYIVYHRKDFRPARSKNFKCHVDDNIGSTVQRQIQIQI